VVEASEVIRRGSLERERHLGDVIQAAIEADLVVQSVPFPSGSFIDIGAPERLAEIWRRAANRISTARASSDTGRAG
jgi:NDP-sugar pyrophosphorylase family protein